MDAFKGKYFQKEIVLWAVRWYCSRRNVKAAFRFLGKALKGLKPWQIPHVLNTDKVASYTNAMAESKNKVSARLPLSIGGLSI